MKKSDPKCTLDFYNLEHFLGMTTVPSLRSLSGMILGKINFFLSRLRNNLLQFFLQKPFILCSIQNAIFMFSMLAIDRVDQLCEAKSMRFRSKRWTMGVGK